MAVDSKHVSATLRMVNPERKEKFVLHRVRPDLDRNAISNMAEGVQTITGVAVDGASMTVTTALIRL